MHFDLRKYLSLLFTLSFRTVNVLYRGIPEVRAEYLIKLLIYWNYMNYLVFIVDKFSLNSYILAKSNCSQPYRWRRGTALKVVRREVPGSNSDLACRPSRSRFPWFSLKPP